MIGGDTLLGLWSVFSGGYSIVSGIKTSRALDTLAAERSVSASDIQMRSQALSRRVSLIESALVLKAEEHRNILTGDGRGFNSIVRGAQNLSQVANDRINVSNSLHVPSTLIRRMGDRPERFLIGVQPLTSREMRPEDSGLMPVVFDYNGGYYIGWQKRDVLSALLELEVDDLGWLDETIPMDADEYPSPLTYRETRTQIVSSARPPASMVILNGPKAGKVLPIEKNTTTVGRVGVQMAAITWREIQGYSLVLMESHPGVDTVTVNSHSIGLDEVLIKNGDLMCIAGIVVEFRV